MKERILLRNSERSAFKQCRFRWDLTYGGTILAAPVRAREPAKALWFGDLVHRALAPYYKKGVKRGPLPARTFLKLYDADDRLAAVLRNDEGEWESLRDLGRGMLEGYVEQYGGDEDWEVIQSEQTFRLPLLVPAATHVLDGSGPSLIIPAFRVTVVGTFDGVWRHRTKKKRVAFKEFKTASTISLDGLAMDDQAGMYWTYGPKWLWRQQILADKTYPSEILYTFLRKAIRNPEYKYDAEGRKLNQDGAVSKSQPAKFYERQPIYRDQADRVNLHERVLEEAREMVLARAGLLTPIKNPGPLHMPNCRGCPVREACELHETGADWEAMLDATTEPWNPYADHELAERR